MGALNLDSVDECVFVSKVTHLALMLDFQVVLHSWDGFDLFDFALVKVLRKVTGDLRVDPLGFLLDMIE